MKRHIKEIFRKHLLFFALIPIVTVSQLYLLQPHLKYGFNDLDYGYRYIFYVKEQWYPNIFQFLYEIYKHSLVYFHQYLLVGILNYFFGENILPYLYLTHTLKILATLSIYPLFFILSGSSLVAFISAIIYSFSGSTVGALEALIEGDYYLAIIMLSIFLSIYFYLIKKRIEKINLLILSLLFLLATLLFCTERTYPVILLILILEFVLLVKDHSVSNIKRVLKRASILLSPILLVIILQPVIIIHFIGPNTQKLLRFLSEGKTELLLIPFTTFTSIFLPSRYWTLSLLMITGIIFGSFIIILLSKKPPRLLLITISVWLLGTILTYFLSKDADWYRKFAIMASAGFYILGLSTSFLLEWLENKEQLFIGLFLGPFYSFLFILSTWAGTNERLDVFVDVHRYLTIPAIFSSFFWGNLIVVLQNRLKSKKILRALYTAPIIIILPMLLVIGSREIKDYFSYKLLSGFAFEDRKYMRQQLLPYYQNLSADNPRLIYIDMYFDHKNKDFYEETLYSAWNAWPLGLPTVDYREEFVPVIIKDYDLLKSAVIEKEEGKGILFESALAISWINKKTFYEPKNFYALRIIDRKVIDITDQVKQELGL